MSLPDWRTSTMTKHGKRADARKRKLSFLAFEPNKFRRDTDLSKRVSTLERQLEASKNAQARLSAKLKITQQQLAQAEDTAEKTLEQLARANATVQNHDAERLKAVERYATFLQNYDKLADKYNKLCDDIQAFICPPINPYGTLVGSPLVKDIQADLGKTAARRLSAQIGVTPLPPLPVESLDIYAPCS